MKDFHWLFPFLKMPEVSKSNETISLQTPVNKLKEKMRVDEISITSKIKNSKFAHNYENFSIQHAMSFLPSPLHLKLWFISSFILPAAWASAPRYTTKDYSAIFRQPVMHVKPEGLNKGNTYSTMH